MEVSTTQSRNDGAHGSRITAWWQWVQPHKAGVFGPLSYSPPRRPQTTSPRRLVLSVLTVLATLMGLSAGEGNRSPTVASAGTEGAIPTTKSSTHRARWRPWSNRILGVHPSGDAMMAHNAPGVSIMKESLRGWDITSNDLRGGGHDSGITSGTGDVRDLPRVFHGGVFQRGGAWFAGYSDTTESESDDDVEEEGEEEQEKVTSEEETSEQGAKTLGEGVAEGDRESGCTIAGETVETPRTESLLEGGNVMEVFHGEGEMSTSGFGWGAKGQTSSVDIEVDVEEKESLEGEEALEGENSEPEEDYDEKGSIKTSQEDDNREKGNNGDAEGEEDMIEDCSYDEENEDYEEGNGDEEDDDYDETETTESSGSSIDVYARTVARRRAISSTLRVFQKAFFRTAILLAAFQMLPWLRHNVVAQWLLLGSIFLQTVNEVVAVINAFSGDGRHALGDTDRDEEASSDAGMGRFSPHSPISSTGMFGGLMRAMSPELERKQHFDFERLNDYFDKDSEALASAGRSKADMAALLAAGAAEDTRLLGASVLRAMKGLTGSYRNGDDKAEESRSSGGGGGVKKGDGDNKKKKMKKSRTTTKNKTSKVKRGSNGYDSDCGAEGVGSDSPEILGRDGSETGARSNGSVSSDGDGHGNGNYNATEELPGPIGNATKKRVFVVKVGSGTGLRQDSSEMDFLSGAVAFLIAKGNSTTDEVVVCLESGGGEVSEFGLGASKLARLKDKGFHLTVCVDKVAASGGYMMACVANRLIAAPFAMLGSIGVVGGIPNFNKALKKAGIEYFHFTAGQHKSLVGPFQEVTRANQQMQQRQIDGVHSAFKRHVRRYRPAVDVEAIGTGEVWLGLDAIKHCLVDEIGTAMEYLESRMVDSQVFLMMPHMPRSVRGSSLLRLLLLGPLAAVGTRRGSSSDLIGEVASLPMDLFSIPPSRDGEGIG